MNSRRSFLKTSVASLVLFAAGCRRIPAVNVSGLPDIAIDVHTHIFNGRDIPVVGFLNQVFLRPADAPVEPNVIDGLVRLLKEILLAETLTAEQEAALLADPAKSLSLDPAGALTRQDSSRVEIGIARFEVLVEPWANSLNMTPNQRMLQILYDLVGNNERKALGPDPEQSQASEIADFIYGVSARDIEDQKSSFRSLNLDKLVSTFKWAGMLTRRRVDILAELKRLYAKTGEINVFCPSFLDFELWLAANEGPQKASPIKDQIDVMAAIAKRETDVMLLNFVGFCPLRAALATRKGKDPLELVKYAIEKNGFAGIKIYPPIGFKPFGNQAQSYGFKPGKTASGAQLNAELNRLYKWCAENDVPIKTHGNNSMGADINTGENANPVYWAGLKDNPETAALRIDIAHFGGFPPPLPNGQPPQASWEETAAALTDENPNIFLDVGFWNEVVPFDQNTDEVTALRALLGRHAAVRNSIMYGSDWSMIGRLPNHNYYLQDVKRAFKSLNIDLNHAMRDNALRFLGLNVKGRQFERLKTFFGETHKFCELFC